MRLFISIGTHVLDSIRLDPQQVKEDGYVDSLCRLLLVKHELVILAYLQTPSFYIQVASDFRNYKRN